MADGPVRFNTSTGVIEVRADAGTLGIGQRWEPLKFGSDMEEQFFRTSIALGIITLVIDTTESGRLVRMILDKKTGEEQFVPLDIAVDEFSKLGTAALEAAATASLVQTFQAFAGFPPTESDLAFIRAHAASRVTATAMHDRIESFARNQRTDAAPEELDAQTLKQALDAAIIAGDTEEIARLSLNQAFSESILDPTEDRQPGDTRPSVFTDPQSGQRFLVSTTGAVIPLPSPIDPQLAALNAERELVDARASARQADRVRSVDEVMARALIAGDFQQAARIQDIRDRPNKLQVLQFMAEFADNPAALQVIFDFLYGGGRGDVVPTNQEAAQAGVPEAPRRISELARQRLIDPAAFAQDPERQERVRTETPPGFGAEVGTDRSFVTAEAFQDPREAPRLAEEGPPEAEQFGFDPAEEEQFTPTLSARRFSAQDLDSPLFQQALAQADPENDPVLHLLVDGALFTVRASQAQETIDRAVAKGSTVEVPNRAEKRFDVFPEDDEGITRFEPGGNRFVVSTRFTPEQLENPLFTQAISNFRPSPLPETNLVRSEVDRNRLPSFGISQEAADRITNARSRTFQPGVVTLVNPETNEVQFSNARSEEDLGRFTQRGFVVARFTPPDPEPAPRFAPSRDDRFQGFQKTAQALKKPEPVRTRSGTRPPFGSPRLVGR